MCFLISNLESAPAYGKVKQTYHFNSREEQIWVFCFNLRIVTFVLSSYDVHVLKVSSRWNTPEYICPDTLWLRYSNDLLQAFHYSQSEVKSNCIPCQGRLPR